MYSKFLTPPALGHDKHLYINVSFNIREIVYINEEQQFIRTKKEVFKEWFNSYLTFQNLKQNATNFEALLACSHAIRYQLYYHTTHPPKMLTMSFLQCIPFYAIVMRGLVFLPA